MLSKVAADLLLLFVAAIWGTTFPVVKNALSAIDPMWFCAVRFFLAGVALVPFFWRDLLCARIETWKRGAVIGFFLFSAYAFQTTGLSLTTSSKAAFITGLYLVIVPAVLAVIERRLPGRHVTAGVVLSVTGLAVLSLEGRMVPQLGDVLVVLCAFSFAAHIVSIEKLGPGHSAGVLTIAQILTVSVLSLICSLLLEKPSLSITRYTWSAILITGLFATSAAYLIQTTVQKFTEATHAALILALEPVFALLFSYLWAGETLTARGVAGATLMFSGMIVTEVATARYS